MSNDADGETDKEELAEERTNMAKERSEMAEERSEMAEQRTDWANERTEWAEHRTILANERTFTAWLRTGMSAMGGGIAAAEFLGGEEYDLLARGLGIILVFIGAVVCAVALWRYNKVTDVLERDDLPLTPKWVVGVLVAGLVIAAVLLLILILLQ